MLRLVSSYRIALHCIQLSFSFFPSCRFLVYTTAHIQYCSVFLCPCLTRGFVCRNFAFALLRNTRIIEDRWCVHRKFFTTSLYLCQYTSINIYICIYRAWLEAHTTHTVHIAIHNTLFSFTYSSSSSQSNSTHSETARNIWLTWFSDFVCTVSLRHSVINWYYSNQIDCTAWNNRTPVYYCCALFTNSMFLLRHTQYGKATTREKSKFLFLF